MRLSTRTLTVSVLVGVCLLVAFANRPTAWPTLPTVPVVAQVVSVVSVVTAEPAAPGDNHRIDGTAADADTEEEPPITPQLQWRAEVCERTALDCATAIAPCVDRPPDRRHDPIAFNLPFSQDVCETEIRPIAGCYPDELQKCLQRGAGQNKWIVFIGDSVTRKMFERTALLLGPEVFEPLEMSGDRHNRFTIAPHYENKEFLAFGQVLLTELFIGGSTDEHLLDNFRVGLQLPEEDRLRLLARQGLGADSLLYRKPDRVFVNVGLWDSRDVPVPQYREQLSKWPLFFHNEMKLSADAMVWRSTTPTSDRLPTQDPSRAEMTVGKISAMNDVAYDIFVQTSGWHFLDQFNLVGGWDASKREPLIAGDRYHPLLSVICMLAEYALNSICMLPPP
ncbi:hypothetical protein CAOG_06836 [Capsaspora owczarzaki ATCC 30864]|uniref:Uncharacterized protein n=1 Tax=Capsaspora owczarzaki (strain ATCC 30864) TaxID=595528 RepID=A0A0D2VXX4_CAPO3|nr:hypothetical protein CAOG_06836 [Capsaspora owczarzaki ATCC 30864]KJE96527.1 hypothetical protein CAOG_006836 [Capsaspora owczarzaki ATCC 30864]|eukprot:XP_004344457.1 hypothetical protein CAOG_06836 [Capsaspora owczarzaki ATCC 30864]